MRQQGLSKTPNSSICTPELQTRFVELVTKGVPLSLACQGVGMAYATYNRWCHRAKEGQEPYATFIEQVYKARVGGVEARLERISNHARKHWQADAWYLERCHNGEFGRRDKVAVDSTVRQGHIDLSTMDVTQLQALSGVLTSELEVRENGAVRSEESLPSVSSAGNGSSNGTNNGSKKGNGTG